jgi:uncharacterized 2Fe-2S/4Fe-4S cluster protein (DUF4445 family)
MFHLTIQLPHEERCVAVEPDVTARRLTDVLRSYELPLNTRCGQRGLCDGCLIELRKGSLYSTSPDGKIDAQDPPQTLRGCELMLPSNGNAVIHVPARSLLAHQPQVVTSFRLNVQRAQDPLWQSWRIAAHELPEGVPIAEALRAAVATELDGTVPLEVDPGLEQIQVQADGTYAMAIEHEGDRWQLSPLRHAEPAYGVAVDIGTTTVVVIVVELTTGRVAGSASALNGQTRLGDNVLTRINLCMQDTRLVRRMQKAVVRGTLAPLLGQALSEAGLREDDVTCMVVAGNTTMLHLLLGVDPTSLGIAPFTPTFIEHRITDSRTLNLQVKMPKSARYVEDDLESCDSGADDEGAVEADTDGAGQGTPFRIHTLPGAAAYVGADITAGVLASGMAYAEASCLLVDLGTNGEIVLKHNGQLYGCATAAGPAFEGAGLTYGVRAGNGAIGHIWLEPSKAEPSIEVIGGGAPIGLCGTAYIDFVARARANNLITPTARFVSRDAPGVFQHPTHGWAYPIAPGTNGEPLLVTEADMASLLQAKAAIAAGVICLLRRAGIEAREVSTVYLAGGFGFHMHIDSLLGCGMLPGFAPKQIELIGNSSLAGAYLTLLDSSALCEIRRLSQRMQIVELNLEPEFEWTYIDQLVLPS